MLVKQNKRVRNISRKWLSSKLHSLGSIREYVEKARRQQDSPIVGFVCGMPRAATSWLSECLESHSDVISFGETGFWGKNFVNSADVYDSRVVAELLEYQFHLRSAALARRHVEPKDVINEIRSIILEENITLGPKELFDWIAASMALASGKTKVIEKTPHHINWIDRMARYYPEARFVAMVRDPYGFMLSYKHQGDRKDPDVRAVFRSLYHPAGCAAMYRRYVRAVSYAQDEYPDRVYVASFSSVEQEPRKLLEDVQRFLGLDPIEDVLIPKTNTSFPNTSRPELAEIDLWWMKTIAGKYVGKMGMSVREASPSTSETIESIAQLPIWAFRVANHFRKDRMTSVWSYVKNLLS